MFPASSIRPSLKALLGPFSLPRCHTLGSCFSDSLFALSSPWACTHAAVVPTPPIRQCLGLARMPGASCVCFALDLVAHHRPFHFLLLQLTVDFFWVACLGLDRLLVFGHSSAKSRTPQFLMYRHSNRPIRPC